MRVVVSLTTIPSRVARIKPMLESLVAQTRKPDSSILWLPKVCRKQGVPYDVPSDLKEWMFLNDIAISECSTDWGPATKLIPTLLCEWENDTIIITLDDDIVYEPHLIEELVAASERWPNDSLGFMGGKKGSQFIHAEQLRMHGIEREPVEILGGYRGIVYRRRMFDESIFEELNELQEKEAFLEDDHLFRWNLYKRGIGCYVIRTDYPGCGNGLNFRFLNLGDGVYDGPNGHLAAESLSRLRYLYTTKGWRIP